MEKIQIDLIIALAKLKDDAFLRTPPTDLVFLKEFNRQLDVLKQIASLATT